MQGYVKNEEQKNFAKEVEKFLMSQKIYFAKNYSDAINEYSKTDYFLCLHGKFIALELVFYSPLPDGTMPKLPENYAKRIKKSNGIFMAISPKTFDVFKQKIIACLTKLKNATKKVKAPAGKKPMSNKPMNRKPNPNYNNQNYNNPKYQNRNQTFPMGNATLNLSKKMI